MSILLLAAKWLNVVCPLLMLYWLRSDVVNNLLLAVRWLRENAFKDEMDDFTKEVFNELVYQDDFFKEDRGTDRYTTSEN